MTSVDALMAKLPRPIDEASVRTLLEALVPYIDMAEEALKPTGDHHVIPSNGYCLDCGGQHIGEWLSPETPA